MKWGSALILVVTPTSECATAVIYAGCLTYILTKYQELFEESGILPVADLPQITITACLGTLLMQGSYQME